MSDVTNRLLTGMMGECWHDYDEGSPVWTCKGGGVVCTKCGGLVVANNDFACAEDFEKLWIWAEKQEELKPFLSQFLPGRLREGIPEERASFADALCRLLTASRR